MFIYKYMAVETLYRLELIELRSNGIQESNYWNKSAYSYYTHRRKNDYK